MGLILCGLATDLGVRPLKASVGLGAGGRWLQQGRRVPGDTRRRHGLTSVF
jgi:hypothetical protein